MQACKTNILGKLLLTLGRGRRRCLHMQNLDVDSSLSKCIPQRPLGSLHLRNRNTLHVADIKLCINWLPHINALSQRS